MVTCGLGLLNAVVMLGHYDRGTKPSSTPHAAIYRLPLRVDEGCVVIDAGRAEKGKSNCDRDTHCAIPPEALLGS